MPPYSTLKTYLQAVNTGQTNITRVLTKLMHYPAQWRPNKNANQITVNPLSPFLDGQFRAPGRMTSQEIAHIENQWPPNQTQELLTEVLRAIDVGRPMVFKWALTSANEPVTDVAWPSDDAPPSVPVQVTFRSPAAGVTYSQALTQGEVEGSDTDVVVAE